jgi:hypothetical protein
MKASDFDIGDAVKDYDTGNRGTVIGNKLSDGDQVVAVEWDDGSLTKANIDDLTKHDTALEAEFAVVQVKITQAAQLLNEANSLLKARGLSLREASYDENGEENFDYSALFTEIRRAGWSTSSMNC